MNVPDVLEDHLLLGFQPEVWAELAAPAEDGGGEKTLLSHLVDLLQVGLDLLVRQEANSEAGELKCQETKIIRFKSLELGSGHTYLAGCTSECLSLVDDCDVFGHLLPWHHAWAGTCRTLHQLQPRHGLYFSLKFSRKLFKFTTALLLPSDQIIKNNTLKITQNRYLIKAISILVFLTVIFSKLPFHLLQDFLSFLIDEWEDLV